MLIVQRRVGERITIGDAIEVTVQSTTRGGVRLAIVAPRGVAVLRGEVHDAIARANANSLCEQSQGESLQPPCASTSERSGDQDQATPDVEPAVAGS